MATTRLPHRTGDLMGHGRLCAMWGPGTHWFTQASPMVPLLGIACRPAGGCSAAPLRPVPGGWLCPWGGEGTAAKAEAQVSCRPRRSGPRGLASRAGALQEGAAGLCDSRVCEPFRPRVLPRPAACLVTLGGTSPWLIGQPDLWAHHVCVWGGTGLGSSQPDLWGHHMFLCRGTGLGSRAPEPWWAQPPPSCLHLGDEQPVQAGRMQSYCKSQKPSLIL